MEPQLLQRSCVTSSVYPRKAKYRGWEPGPAVGGGGVRTRARESSGTQDGGRGNASERNFASGGRVQTGGKNGGRAQMEATGCRAGQLG